MPKYRLINMHDARAKNQTSIYIRHFQHGGVYLHFTRASFNTVFSKSNFKITLIFSKKTLHFNQVHCLGDQVWTGKGFLYNPIRCSTTSSGFHAEDHFW